MLFTKWRWPEPQPPRKKILALREAVENKFGPLLTTKEVANILQCSVTHVSHLRQKRMRPGIKIGRSRRFRCETVIAEVAALEDWKPFLR